MSSTNYRTSRDLFLSHHWRPYVAFDRARDAGYRCGRITAKDENTVRLDATSSRIASWSEASLREPAAAESAPPVHEVLGIGDWIGVNDEGLVVLYAPCGNRLSTPNGTSVLQSAESFQKCAEAWADFLAKVRQFFKTHAFLEMTTPSLAPSPGTEPFLDPLSVLVESGGVHAEKFLITSPEFHLKKALAAGLPRVFEIAKCFRNREGGAHHRIEFHMLEWYRSFASLEEIADDLQSLIVFLCPDAKLVRTTMRELFLHQVKIALDPETTRDELAAEAKKLGVRTTEDDSFDDVFHRIFIEKIEPHLAHYSKAGPLLISDYPPSMAALARLTRDGFADRFEVYWKGFELCNAFHELNDPFENRQRFDADNRAKVNSGRAPVPLDDELLRAFDLGVPPAGGIALGLERLFMAVHDLKDIARVRPYQAELN